MRTTYRESIGHGKTLSAGFAATPLRWLTTSSPIKSVALAAVLSTLLGAAANQAALGKVHFQNSCKAVVQAEFDEAIALLHSFEFSEAEKLFAQVARQDPTCSIAAWGLALAETERAGAHARRETLAAGWKQLQPWLAMQAKTVREQSYVEAIRSMYEGYVRNSGEERWHRYLEKMSAISHDYPEDTNASLFYALGLVWTSGPGPSGIAQRRNALAILLPIFAADPDNPGTAHYIIHAADTPELAAIALPAARKYARIAPDSPDAPHMPSHIFGRLGYWREMVSSNQDSARAAAKWMQEGKDGRFDELHALTYLEYAYLQLAEHGKAREQIAHIRTLMNAPGGDTWAEVDARILYDVQTSDWQDALKINAPASSSAQDNFDIYWVRTIAAAHLGNIEVARRSLRDLSDSIAHQKGGSGFADALHIYFLQAQGALEASEGHAERAVAVLKSALVFEHQHPMDYPNVLAPPSAECLGLLFLKLHQPDQAQWAFQQELIMAPQHAKCCPRRQASDRDEALIF